MLVVFFLFAVMIFLVIPFGYASAKTHSPLQQIVMGVDPHNIQCDSGKKLVFKASNWRPACVDESSFGILLSRGWIASNEPSSNDLMKMVDDYMTVHPEMKKETQDEVKVKEGMSIEGKTNTGSENQTSQNYTVDLRESMEMGAK